MAEKHGIEADVSLADDGEVESVTIKSANGAQVGRNLKLPDGFPDDVPVPSDWAIMSASPTPGGFMVQAMTDDSIEDALAQARAQLSGEGWTETDIAQPSLMITQVGFTKSDRMTNLNLMDTGATRTVQLVTMQRPQ